MYMYNIIIYIEYLEKLQTILFFIPDFKMVSSSNARNLSKS